MVSRKRLSLIVPVALGVSRILAGILKFSGEKRLKNYLRLSFAYYDVPELEEGARRLGRVIEKFGFKA